MDDVVTQHVEVTPGVCDGKPRISGHRITVQNIVIWHDRTGLAEGETLRLRRRDARSRAPHRNLTLTSLLTPGSSSTSMPATPAARGASFNALAPE